MHWNKAVANRLQLGSVARMHNCFEADHVTRKLKFKMVQFFNLKVTSSSFLASAGLLWNNLIKSDKHLDISWLWFSSVGISTFPFSFLVWRDLTKDFLLVRLNSMNVPVRYLHGNDFSALS